ncbi:uncharacterized protein LOC121912796 [Thunnus maccoyii]|uniref:uncharacterized protein LOC121912796 n=1 Tax=Thunnus maccoyii TaxID=8240 RepID=UPI001C4B0C22|nr:uncharacterized protein LOC121912796 [Thunnus maccoyii]
MMKKEDLVKTLEDLIEKEFEDFKWLLKDESLEGHQAIKASQLEKAERQDTVDLMVQTYQLPGAVEVTKKLLKKINRNDLLQILLKAELGKKNAEIQQMIQKRRLKIDEIKHSVDLSKEDADREKAEGVQVFTALKESVERSLNELIETIEENQRMTEKQAEDNIRELEQEISELKKRSSEVEQLSHSEDHLHLLQNFLSLEAAPPTKDWTVVSVRPPSYEGTVVRAVAQLEETLSKEMKKLVKAELKRVQQYAVDVTLDPDTAHSNLTLSRDGKQVNHGYKRKNLPDNPERFSYCPNVLGKQSFSSGRFYFEVQVKGKTEWDLGVVRESINRKGMITLRPQDGYWTIVLRNGNQYKACAGPSVRLSLKSQPQKVGVFVDYEEGLVFFYDIDAAALIYSFTGCSFTEKLYPYFGPSTNDGGKNSAPLIICPVNQTLQGKMKKEDLVKTLEGLIEKEFEDFKWLLKDDSLEDHQVIKASQLEKAERQDTVDLMVQTYQLPGAVEVTKKLLKKINRNDLLQSLSDSSSGPEDDIYNDEEASENRRLSSFQLLTDSSQREVIIWLVPTHQEPPVKVSHDKRHQLMDPVENLEDRMCMKHNKPLELFCKTDQKIVCVLCAYSDHKTHDVVPLEEEYEGKKAELGKKNAEIQQMIQKRRLKIDEIKHSVDLSKEDADREKAEAAPPTKDWTEVSVRPPSYVRTVVKAVTQLEETLRKQSFSSGRFYFEVQVKWKTEWTLGVVRESINRKGRITARPQNGYWIIGMRNGYEYKAGNDPSVRLSLKSWLQKVGVFVDYEEGLVFFYDVDTAALIYSFTGCSFTEKLYPYFGPSTNDGGKNSAPLIICPVNQTA